MQSLPRWTGLILAIEIGIENSLQIAKVASLCRYGIGCGATILARHGCLSRGMVFASSCALLGFMLFRSGTRPQTMKRILLMRYLASDTNHLTDRAGGLAVVETA